VSDTRARVRDPYTGEDLGPADPGAILDLPIETGYDGIAPNPVYRGLPYAYLEVGPDGEIAGVRLKGHPDVRPDEKDAAHKATFQRMRRRTGDGLGSGGVVVPVEGHAIEAATLPPDARGPTMQTPASRAGGSQESAPLSHGSREAAHDDAHAASKSNRSHTSHKPMTRKPKRNPATTFAGTSDPITPGTEASIDDLTLRMDVTPVGDRMIAEVVAGLSAPERPALTLYDLTDRWLALELFIDEHAEEIINAGGDLDAVPGLVEQLDALEGALAEKVERVVLFIENRAAIEKARRAQAVKFGRLADLDKRVVENLKAYLVRCQRRAGKPKIETTHCTSTVCRNSQQSLERAVDATPLSDLHAGAFSIIQSAENREPFPGEELDPTYLAEGQMADALLACIDVEQPPPIYSLNRAKILEIWKTAFTTALAQHAEAYTPDGSTSYELDRAAHAEANRHPVLVALGVTVEQGYHVRIK